MVTQHVWQPIACFNVHFNKRKLKKNSIDAPIAAIRGNHKMAVIDEGEDLTEIGEEVIAKVKQFL